MKIRLQWKLKRKTVPELQVWIFNVCLFIYLFILRQRETEHEQGRDRERGKHRIKSRLQALSCQHRAWCRARTHKLWDCDLSQSWTLNQLSHPRAPLMFILFILSERERESKHEGGGVERGKERIPSRLHTFSTESEVGLEPMNCEIMTWAQIKS